jgi:hypothetical protein
MLKEVCHEHFLTIAQIDSAITYYQQSYIAMFLAKKRRGLCILLDAEKLTCCLYKLLSLLYNLNTKVYVEYVRTFSRHSFFALFPI